MRVLHTAAAGSKKLQCGWQNQSRGSLGASNADSQLLVDAVDCNMCSHHGRNIKPNAKDRFYTVGMMATALCAVTPSKSRRQHAYNTVSQATGHGATVHAGQVSWATHKLSQMGACINLGAAIPVAGTAAALCSCNHNALQFQTVLRP